MNLVRIYQLRRDENDREWWAYQEGVPSNARPNVVLSTWLDDHQPDPGTYKAQQEVGGAMAVLGWQGQEAA